MIAIGNRKIGYILFAYSLLFIILSWIIFQPFLANQKSLIWWGDGMDQHFPAFYYLGNYFKTNIPLLLTGNFSQIAMIDFSIGFGFDILTTLSYYGFGDPLVLLAAFAAPEQMENFYNGVILLRLYLAGIGFLCYCFYMRLDNFFSLIGVFLYIFSGYALYASIRHPFFCISMVYLPFMLIAIERLIESAGQKGLFLAVVTALSAISNFYFFYMLTVIAFFYGMIRFFDIRKKNTVKKILSFASKAIFYYLLGICLAAVIFLPVLIAFKNNARLQTLMPGFEWKYNWSYYLKVLYGLFSPAYMDDHWSILNLTPLVLFSMIALFFERRRYQSLKRLLMLFLIILAIPAGGSFMNGMGYISNRWIWGLSFLLAIIMVLMAKDMLYYHNKYFHVITSVVAVLCIIPFFYQPLQNTRIFAGIILCCLLLLIIFNFKDTEYQKTYFSIILIYSVATVTLNGFFLYSSNQQNYVREFIGHQEGLGEVQLTPMLLDESVTDSEFYRTSQARHATSLNKSLVLGYYGTTSYFSITNQYFAKYCFDLELSSLWTLCRMDGLESRSALESLASVKYFYAYEHQNRERPYSFQEIFREQTEDKLSLAYQNENFLPLGYTYSSYIPYETYTTLSALEKQEAMLQGIVLLETPSVAISEAALQNNITRLDYTISCDGNTFYDKDNKILVVTENNVELTFHFESPAESELYLRLNRLNLDGSGSDLLFITGRNQDNTLSTDVHAYSQESSAYSNFYSGIENFMFHLGYSDEPQNSCTLEFLHAGTYQLDDFEIYSVTMENRQHQIEALKEDILEAVTVSSNLITGTVSIETDKILCFSVPYSTGWKASVNGIEQPLLRANETYLALELPAGTYDIELRYCTPGLITGAYISGIALGIAIFIFSVQIIKFKKVRF